MPNTSDSASFIGLLVEQVRCEDPIYQHLVGRKSHVVDAFTDEKGQVHLKTEDGIWCPARLVASF